VNIVLHFLSVIDGRELAAVEQGDTMDMDESSDEGARRPSADGYPPHA